MENRISKAAHEILKPDNKIGILATVDNEGSPHLSFISSLQSLGDTQIIFGSKGSCKQYIEERPDAAFLALSADMLWLRGSMRFTHYEQAGNLVDAYKDKPLFYDNSNLQFNRVYFSDLITIEEIRKLRTAAFFVGAVITRVKAMFTSASELNMLTQTEQALFSEAGSLKFLCWRDNKGLSDIVPIVQALPAGSDRIVFSAIPYGEDFTYARKGEKAAVLCLNPEMRGVLVKGRFLSKGVLAIERAYSSNEYCTS